MTISALSTEAVVESEAGWLVRFRRLNGEIPGPLVTVAHLCRDRATGHAVVPGDAARGEVVRAFRALARCRERFVGECEPVPARFRYQADLFRRAVELVQAAASAYAAPSGPVADLDAIEVVNENLDRAAQLLGVSVAPARRDRADAGTSTPDELRERRKARADESRPASIRRGSR